MVLVILLGRALMHERDAEGAGAELDCVGAHARRRSGSALIVFGVLKASTWGWLGPAQLADRRRSASR